MFNKHGLFNCVRSGRSIMGLPVLSWHGAFLIEAGSSEGGRVEQGLFCLCQVYGVIWESHYPAKLKF